MSVTDQDREDRAAMEVLRDTAEDVSKDITDNYPGLDTSYDLWAERLSLDGIEGLFGVIDMGDVYQGVYLWVEEKWEIHNHQAEPVIAAILEIRSLR